MKFKKIQGAFGEVRKAVHKTTRLTRAIKIINKFSTSQEDQKKLLNEVNILKELVNIQTIYLIFFNENMNFFLVYLFHKSL